MISYRARWILPVSRPPLENGCVTVHQGRVLYVGPLSSAPTVEMRDLGNVILLPGLVNAHTHLELTAMRGFLEDLPFRPWIMRLTRARQAVLDREQLFASALVGIAEGVLAGVTTFADATPSGVSHEALRAAGVRGLAYREVFGPHPDQCTDAMAELQRGVQDTRVKDTAQVRTGISPHAPYTVSDTLFTAAGEFARSESLPISVHIAESEDETLLVRDGAGAFAEGLQGRGIPVAPRAPSPIALLHQTGVLRAQPLLVHCVRIGGVDMTRMLDYGCGVAHCPASNAKLGHGIAPLAEMLELGLAVGIGTDSVGSNNRMDPLDDARLALLLQRARLESPQVIPAARALEMATLGAARAIGMAREVGSLDVGKEADFACFALEGAREVPVHDPVSALIFAIAGRPAKHVFISGREIVRDGRLSFDTADARKVVARSAEALQGWARANVRET